MTYKSKFLGLVILALSLSFTNTSLKKRKTPPGTVRINDTLFVDQTEIGNVHWREFLFWTIAIDKDTAKYESMLLDTTVWHDMNLGWEKYYHNHPSYNYYPVVGVSYEQAIAYCKWRSDRVNENYKQVPSNNPFPGREYVYNLPSKEEWEIAAAGKLEIAPYPYGLASGVFTIFRRREIRSFNAIYTSKDSSLKPLSIESFKPNQYGIVNTAGNVAEMISKKGIAKGGSFMHKVEDCKIINEQAYSQPENWLGFRCVCKFKN